MATITVTTNADSGTGSLRQAIADAASGDTIVFDSTVFPVNGSTTIALSSQLSINKILTIDAQIEGSSNNERVILKPTTNSITLSGASTVVNFKSIVFADSPSHTLLLNAATIYAYNCTFENNKDTSTNGGGAIYLMQSGYVIPKAYLYDCLFLSNTATKGSAISAVFGGQIVAKNCIFSSNSASAIYVRTGSYAGTYNHAFTNCVFSGSGECDVFCSSDAYRSNAQNVSFNGCNSLSSGFKTEITSDSSGNVVFNLSGYTGINNIVNVGIRDPTFSGSGFLALPSSASVTLPNTITRTVYGAGVSNFNVVGTTLSWNSVDATKSVLLEKKNGANWDVVSTSATSPTTVLADGSYRIWDGATFLAYIQPQTLIVTNTNDSGAGSLRQALADATAIDTITFDATLSGSTITLASGLTLTDAVEIVGLTDANGDPAITISGANTYRILSGDYKMTLSNLIFANAGNCAIYNEDAAGSSFTNCVFSNNSATDSYAGAVCLIGVNATTDSVSFTDCVFSGNESRTTSVNGWGGALSTSNLNVNATDCTFTNNTAHGELGGAVAFMASVSTLTLDGCTFTGNSIATRTASTGLKDCGGAIYASGDVVATDCTFTNNSVANQFDGDEGGAVVALNSATFTNCTFSGNSTTDNGGAICLKDGSITGCTFEYNNASTGGGVCITGGVGLRVIVSGCTFTSNTASNGADVATINTGRLYVPSGIVTIPNIYAASGSTVSIENGAALSCSESATIAGTVSATIRAYLATPPGTDLTGATLTNIVACDYGAGVSAFSIDENSADWTAVNSNISVLLEKKVNNAWQTLAQTTGTSYSTTFVDGDEARIFDGVQFRTASAVVPTTIVVTNTNTTGAGSLAQAVLDARAVDTITFDPSLAGETITLNAGLGPRNEITIVGLTDSDGNPAITVDGNGNYTFNSSYPVHISNVAFNGGWGAFSSLGGFDGSTFENCTFENMDLNVFELSNNSQTAESVSFTDCTFTSNDAADVLIIGNVNATLSGGNVLTEGFDLTDATTTVITNANYNGVGGYSAPSAGSVSVAGSGNIALPDAAVVTVAQTVTRSEFGAGLTAISANELTISWTATDSTKSVLLEKQNGANWDVVDDSATSPTTVSTEGRYRVWDGVVFLTIDVTKTRYWQVRAWADMTAGGGGIGDASPAWIVTNKTTGPNLNGN